MEDRTYPDFLVEMLEAATHQIIFLRNVYPKNVFVKRKKYGIPTMMADHPWVANFIAEHLKSLRDSLGDKVKREGLEKMEVLINRGEEVLEKHVFDFGHVESEGRRLEERERERGSIIYGEELELKFRSLLLRLNAVLTDMDELGEDDELTFSFRLRTSARSAESVTTTEDGWMAVDDDSDEEDPVVLVERSLNPKKIVPVYGMRHPVSLNVFILK